LGCAYNYGYNAARHAFRYTAARTGAATGKAWWLDIETGNTWSADVHSNRADIRGMLDYLNSQPGVTPGIYSNASQWAQITGGAALASTPVWLPSIHKRSHPSTFCESAYSFTGGPVTLVQYPAGSFDGDYAC
jgi:GH25 family lysozyme M1 (1,4-beta-N-acetylmuramidase)